MKNLISTLLAVFLTFSVGYSQKKVDAFKVKTISINDAESNTGVSFFKGDFIIYTHPKEGRGIYDNDFYSSLVEDNGNVQAGELLDETFNSYINERDMVFTSDFKKVYFTRYYIFNEKEGNDIHTYDIHYDIYVADVKDDNSISNLKTLPINYEKFSTAHPSLSADDKTLYFSSNRKESMGGFDIFKVAVTKNARRFGKVINLGPNVNTTGDETTPYVYGDKLYFSSNGRGGYGKQDVFEAKIDLSEVARNLGETLNSNQDDFGFIRKKQSNQGFFVSNKAGGKGDNDIYYYTSYKVDAPLEVEEIVKTEEVKELIEDEVTMFEILDKEEETVAIAKTVVKEKVTPEIIKSTSTLENAVEKTYSKETTQVKQDTSLYEEEVIYEESNEVDDNVYAFQRRKVYEKTKVEISRTRTKIRDLSMDERECVHRVGRLNDIYFDLNKSNIRPSASLEINKAIRIMKKCPNLRFVASSYTDSRGLSEYNKRLSQRRASAVVKYILKNSDLEAEIIGVGYGESGLKNKCSNGVKCTNREHQVNRRTEIEISLAKKKQ